MKFSTILSATVLALGLAACGTAQDRSMVAADQTGAPVDRNQVYGAMFEITSDTPVTIAEAVALLKDTGVTLDIAYGVVSLPPRSYVVRGSGTGAQLQKAQTVSNIKVWPDDVIGPVQPMGGISNRVAAF